VPLILFSLLTTESFALLYFNHSAWLSVWAKKCQENPNKSIQTNMFFGYE